MPLEWLALSAALLTGLAGSTHCALMCGGIATGIASLGPRRLAYVIEPNLGRVLGYTMAGAIAGGIGSGIVGIARIDGLAQALRVGAGLVLVLAALRLLDRRGRLAFVVRAGTGLWARLRPLQQRLLPADTSLRRIGLGMLWGWLPCGLSTSVLAVAWLQADARNGALVMLAFGLGTLPMMLPLSWSGARLAGWLQDRRFRNGAGIAVLLAGLLTATAPWLAHAAPVHGLLVSLGCLPPGAH